MAFQKNAGAVYRFAKAMKFGAWLHALPGKLVPPPFRLVQIGSSFWTSRALYVAARLDIATRLGDAELGAAEIAARISADADAVARLLRMLAAMGIFAETAPRVFRNNPLSSCLRTDNPKSVRAMILMHNSPTMSRPWFEQLERGVREGTPPFLLAHGKDLYDHLDRHPDFDQLFSDAMDSVEALAGDGFATDFDWGRFGRIIDVGGSRGAKSRAILARHPGLTALVLDRPGVIAAARRHWAAHHAYGVERMDFLAWDLLAPLPAASDARNIYLLSAVLHGFDDSACVAILRNLGRAIGASGARVALFEMVLPSTRADLAGASLDMQMFMATRGRVRTLEEWRTLFVRAGLALEEVVGLRSFGNILVLRASRDGQSA